tara:strand:- start:665 stop:1039 length:375 start_codon:yes stop_codon:yes gene_type:complete
MNNRFDLETEIMSVWHTADDLDTMLYKLIDAPGGSPSEDTIANMLVGLKEIHEARCEKLMEVFENMLKDDLFNDGMLHEDDLQQTESKELLGTALDKNRQFIALDKKTEESYADKFKKWQAKKS